MKGFLIFLLALLATVTAQGQPCYNTPYLASDGGGLIPLDSIYLNPCFLSLFPNAVGVNSMDWNSSTYKSEWVELANTPITAVYHSYDCDTVYHIQYWEPPQDTIIFMAGYFPPCMVTYISEVPDTVLVTPNGIPSAPPVSPYQCDPKGVWIEDPLIENSYLYYDLRDFPYTIKPVDHVSGNAVYIKRPRKRLNR